jgi:regulator of protease activity HflC (stomatin/prohibitin superfamily)
MELDQQKLRRSFCLNMGFTIIAFCSLVVTMAVAGDYQKLWILLGVLALFVVSGIRFIKGSARGVVFRLGRFSAIKVAGLRWIIPGVDRMVRVSLRETVMDIPTEEVITRDRVPVKVNAVLYFRVVHPELAVINVENYLYGTAQMAQATLRDVCGRAKLNELHSHRERLNRQLRFLLDKHLEPWGIEVLAVEVKQIDRG